MYIYRPPEGPTFYLLHKIDLFAECLRGLQMPCSQHCHLQCFVRFLILGHMFFVLDAKTRTTESGFRCNFVSVENTVFCSAQKHTCLFALLMVESSNTPQAQT